MSIASAREHRDKILWALSTRRYRLLGAIVLIAVAMLATIPGRGVRNYAARARFFATCVREIKQISDLSVAAASASLAKTLQERPHVIGVAAWPYINALWSPAERFAVLQSHYAEIEQLPRLQIGPNERVQVSDLSDVFPGLKVVIDRPSWFMREGELAVNLFKDKVRAYSLAFAFGRLGDERVAYVGCIQGHQADGVEQLYRDMTKSLHGWRPRDVMVSLAQMIASASGASRVFFVAEDSRVHRHAYFGDRHTETASANYDEIWSEHGAVRVEGGFFALDAQIQRREPHEIASKKRAMYRRRYELMDRLEADVRKLGKPAPALLA